MLGIGKLYHRNIPKVYTKLLLTRYIIVKQLFIEQPSLSITFKQYEPISCIGIGTLKVYGNCEEFM